MNKTTRYIFLILAIPQALLTAIASYFGAFNADTYAKETLNYAAQGIGQDLVNLFFVAPLLLICAILFFKKNKKALILLGGTSFYLAYSYAIYAFALRFNGLFLIYCGILGLSFYTFVFYILQGLKEDLRSYFNTEKSTIPFAVFLFFIAFLFYAIWLKDIIPALISGNAPKGVIENNLLTNPIHVLDLAICLPLLVISGVFLIKKQTLGYLLAPAMLFFCLVMAVAIGAMVIVMLMKGTETDIVLSVIFVTLALISALFLLIYLKNIVN